MKPFMNPDFLLSTDTAKQLYHTAKSLPIIDYHCHLDPKEIYENKKFENITEAWLLHDHYKWRFLRFCGVDESLITGAAPPKEKFMAFAENLYLGAGHPLYHWCHLELRRYFDIHEVLSEKTAEEIWARAARVMQETDFTPQSLISRSNVRVICTTDDPASDLIYHQKLRAEGKCAAKVLPTFRPDRALAIGKPDFTDYIASLSNAAGIAISSFSSLVRALESRLQFFCENGCVLSDHSFERMDFSPCTAEEADDIFRRRLQGEQICREDTARYFTCLFLTLARQYAERGIAMQIHIGALRNNNARAFSILGPDTGYDSVNDFAIAESLSRFLDTLEQENALPKTVLYPLNSKDNGVLSTMAGNFQSGGVRGKVQLGPAWWFNDHKDGMEEQLRAVANTGALGVFIGMLTDSRSFLSYARHEYFRRIFCDFLGSLVENGEYPDDPSALERLVRGVCFENANQYFSFEVK